MFFGAKDNLKTLKTNTSMNERIEVADQPSTPSFIKSFCALAINLPPSLGIINSRLSYDLSAIDSEEPAAKSLGIAPKTKLAVEVVDSLKSSPESQLTLENLNCWILSATAEADNPIHSFLTLAADGLHKDAGTWLGVHYQPLDAMADNTRHRVDLYSDPDTSHWAVQPRIQEPSIRKQKTSTYGSKQPPVFTTNLPGLFHAPRIKCYERLRLGLLAQPPKYAGRRMANRWDVALGRPNLLQHSRPHSLRTQSQIQ